MAPVSLQIIPDLTIVKEMADAAAPNYTDTLAQALVSRKDWLERSELNKLKEELRIYQISYSVLYNMYLKKKLINEDPYKQETKISDLEIPDTGPFNEAKRHEQISLRLASYDSQLDFLVNFYQFEVDFLNIDRIRRILGLVRYIDWASLTPDSQSPNTKVVAEITNRLKSGGDPIALSIIGESLSRLPKCTAKVVGILRDLSVYHKESYKLSVRNAIPGLQASEADAPAIKKKMNTAMPRTPFYMEYIEELVKEDFSKDGPALREAVLKSLAVAEEKQQVTKAKVNYKGILLDGIQAMGASAMVTGEIAQKIDENQAVLANHKKTFWEKIRLLIRQMTNSEPDAVVYELNFIDQATGAQKTESLNFFQFRADLDKRIRILTGMNGQGQLMGRLNAMAEEQILGHLERTIRDSQNYFRTLSALDDYFKSTVSKEDRDKIKGIKPELASIKNCIVKANQIRHDYSAQKEEEQMKRLGIHPSA
jgi:hypothetical protein